MTAEVRVPAVVALAAAIAVLTAWALRDQAQFPPTSDARPNLLTTAGHGHTGDGYRPLAPVLGDAVANHLGLGMFALHVLAVAVFAVSCAGRRWCRSAMNSPGVVIHVLYAAAVGAGAAVVAVSMAGLLMSGAISFVAAMTATTVVLRFSFVLTLVFTAVFGIP